LLEPGQLGPPTHQARAAARQHDVDARTLPPEAFELVHPHRIADAFERELAEIAQLEVVGHQRGGGLGDAGTVRAGELLDALRETYRVALRGIVGTRVVADRPDDDLAGVQAHAHREVEAAPAAELVAERAQPVAQMQGSETGALSVILVGDRRTEESHDAIAGVLIDGPCVAVHAVVENVEEAIEHLVPFLGTEPLRQVHRVLNVGEQHGDLLVLALDMRRGERMPALFAELRAVAIGVTAGAALHARFLSQLWRCVAYVGR
jgi:hypothetical protein